MTPPLYATDRRSVSSLSWHPLGITAWPVPPPPPPRKSATVAWLLWLLGGWLGAHRFYLGRWASGVVYLVSFGVFGLGVLVDLFVLPMMIRDANATAAPMFVVGTAGLPLPLPLPAPPETAPPAAAVTPAPAMPSAPKRRCDYCDAVAMVGACRCGECGAVFG